MKRSQKPSATPSKQWRRRPTSPRLKNSIPKFPNRLEASIAFGLFMESEGIWAEHEGDPSDSKYRKYQTALLNDFEIGRYARQAREFLTSFGNDAVAAKRTQFLEESLRAHEAAARIGHSRFRGRGVWEAFVGAFCWTVFLIVMFFLPNDGRTSVLLRNPGPGDLPAR